MALTSQSLLTKGFSNGEPLIPTHTERLNTYLGAAQKQYEQLKGDLVGFTNQQNQQLRAFTQLNKADVARAADMADIEGFDVGNPDEAFDTLTKFDEYSYGDQGDFTADKTPRVIAAPNYLEGDDSQSWLTQPQPQQQFAVPQGAGPQGPQEDSKFKQLQAAIQRGATLG